SSWRSYRLNAGGVLLATSYFRIHADCYFCRRYRIYRLQRVGPHVCHGIASAKRKLLHRCEPDDCDSYRNAILLLDGDDMAWTAPASVADALVLWILLHFLDRWTLRGDAGFRARGSAGARYLLRSGALPLCSHRRRPFSDVCRTVFLVSED